MLRKVVEKSFYYEQNNTEASRLKEEIEQKEVIKKIFLKAEKSLMKFKHHRVEFAETVPLFMRNAFTNSHECEWHKIIDKMFREKHKITIQKIQIYYPFNPGYANETGIIIEFKPIYIDANDISTPPIMDLTRPKKRWWDICNK